MTHWIFSTVWGWIGTAGLIVAACAVVGYLVPAWRPYVIAVGIVAVSVASAFSKGWRARGVSDRADRDAAVKKAQEDYDHIETRPDTPDTVADRLRKNSF